MPRWSKWIIAGLLSLIALSAQAQQPRTQCVSTALASGTGDAIAIPLLPCTVTTTLLILTLTAPNSTSSPSISVNGQTPHTILNFDGTALGIGVFQPNQRRILTYNGMNWIMLNGTGSSSSPCGNNPSATLGFFPVLIKTTSYTVQLTDQCSFIVYEGGGAGTFTLPPPTAGFVFWVVNLSASNLTLQPPVGHVNLETSLIVPTGSGGMLDSDGTLDSWFFAFSPPGGGGGGCGGSNGVAGQDCVSIGGSGGVWAQEIIGAPGNPGSTTTIQGGAGISNASGGPVDISAGAGDTNGIGGNLTLSSGLGGNNAHSGNVTLQTPNVLMGADDRSGNITISTGNGDTNGNSGTITQQTGAAGTAGDSGGFVFQTGNASGGQSGDIVLQTGLSGSGSATGNIVVNTNPGAGGGLAGSVFIGSGVSSPPSVTPGGVQVQSAGGFGVDALAGDVGFGIANNIATARNFWIEDAHLQFFNAGGSDIPTLGSCGASPIFVRAAHITGGLDTDTSGVVQVGTGGTTACTVTFFKPFTTEGNATYSYPACVATVYDVNIGVHVSAISTTSVTFSFSADMSGDRFAYFCPQ